MSKREDILKATLDLIDEEGLQSVTFAKIFKRAKVGSGTLFNYFSSKEELVNEVYRQARLHLAEHLLVGYDSQASLYERYKCIQLNRIRFAVDCSKEFLFIDSYSYSPYITPELRHMDDNSTREALSIIMEGQKQGLLKEMDPQFCYQLLHGMIASVIKGYLVGKYPLDEIHVQQTIEACWKAVRI
ncbi:TetR/AcrR family transcriptional regulator [Paenibacillus sp. MBLB2552]|uniref:TetR/AcrR family transcriptional regulator n=1 Tax=Paenibacillus mellifer TaxID=2937794 RepID=A0A9X2BV72_9BACL|nr:TetR/AcrR family transcriptional regulator [Paenibacillus mellifer]MCK8489846.1 TetR/AcrR family transcriptional regulator [Paenibacillus mellifer]